MIFFRILKLIDFDDVFIFYGHRMMIDTVLLVVLLVMEFEVRIQADR